MKKITELFRFSHIQSTVIHAAGARVSLIAVTLVLLLIGTGPAWATDVTVPDAIGGVTPSGPPYTYDYSGNPLNLGSDNILHPNAGDVTFTGITTLTNGTGGAFDWTASGSARPNLTINGSSQLNTRGIDTSCEANSGNFGGGSLFVTSTGGGILIDGTIVTTASDNGIGGDVNITAGGAVNVVSAITTAGEKQPGAISISGSSVTLGGTVNMDGNSNQSTKDITLTATNGTVAVTGDIYQRVNGKNNHNRTASISGSAGVSITGSILSYINNNESTTRGPGTISITSGEGGVTVGGTMDTSRRSDSNNDTPGGPVTVTAAVDIAIGTINTYSSSTNAPATGGAISVTSTTGDIYVGTMNASCSVQGGDVVLSAANGTITLGSLDVDKLNVVALDAMHNGLIVTGAIDGLTVVGDTVQGGFKSGMLSGDILYSAAANPSLSSPPYRILDKVTSADTNFRLVTSFATTPQGTVILLQ